MSDQARSSRRLRFGFLSAVLILAATASIVIAAAIAGRYSVRFDATATREHSLSERTQLLLDRIERPVELVVVADDRRLDARARQRVDDVLDAFEESSPLITVTRINPVTDSGAAEFSLLRSRVHELYQSDLTKRIETLDATSAQAREIAEQLRRFSEHLLTMQAPLSQAGDSLAEQVSNVAAAARIQARSLDTLIEEADASPWRSDATMLEPLRVDFVNLLGSLRDQLHQLTSELAGAAAGSSDPAIREKWRQAGRMAEAVRDEAARSADALDRLGRSESDLVLRILESADAVLILSEGRSTAVQFASLFPATETINEAGGSATDLGFIGEELIATAIASLNRPTTPILVLVHNLPGRLFNDAGAPATPQTRQVIGAMIDRLHLRGVSFAEWATASDSTRPTLARENPDGARPVVWFCFGTEGTSADAAARFDAYATAVVSLLRNEESVLVSVAPSTRPASGATDPIAAALADVGIEADMGRPLIRRVRTSTGEAFDLSHVIRAGAAEFSVGRAVDGLPTMLAWLTSVRPAEGAGDIIFAIENNDDVWAEAEWRSFAAAPDDRAWASPSPPTPNPSYDDVEGPWPIGAAVTRPASLGKEQRIIAIGSPGWFFDRIAARQTTTEGRTVRRHPGNLELLEASVYWLAGQDDMIASSARAAEIPRIGAMSDAQLATMRWGLILGLPAAVLILGAVMRWTLLR